MTTDEAQDYEALLQFLYMAPIGLLQARADGEILMINPLCAQLLMPLSADGQLVNLFAVLSGVAPDLALRVSACAEGYGKIVEDMQLPIYAGPQGRRDAQVLSLTLLKLDEGRLMAVVNDVTAVVQRERQLRHSQAWIETIVTGLTDYALVELDADGRVRRWNASIGSLTGFEADAVCGRPLSVFYAGDAMSDALLQGRLAESRQSGWCLDEGWRQRADGSQYWGSCLIAPLSHDADDPEDRGYSLIVRNIHESRDAREALRSAVCSDQLTGLTNRRAFHELAANQIERWHRQPRPLSLLLINADHFSRVNDDHGPAAGDAVLRNLAAALGAGVCSLDSVARLGGEEFAALLPGTDIGGAQALAERLCQHIAAQPVTVDGRRVAVTVSIGVVQMTADIESVNSFMYRANQAMHAAKRQGRNRAVHWQPGLTLAETA